MLTVKKKPIIQLEKKDEEIVKEFFTNIVNPYCNEREGVPCINCPFYNMCPEGETLNDFVQGLVNSLQEGLVSKK